MMTDDSIQDDIETVRSLVGEPVFARAQACHDAGHVKLITVRPERMVAHVEETPTCVYYTELSGRGVESVARCGCTSARNKICRHVVAAVLTATAGGSEGAADVAANVVSILMRRKPKSPPRPKAASVFSQQDDDETVEAQLRKAIDDATGTVNADDPQAIERLVSNMLPLLQSISSLARSRRAAIALKLAEHAVDRIAQAALINDDSPYYRWNKAIKRAVAIHVTAVRKARPDPVQLARFVFNLEFGPGSLSSDARDKYGDLLSEAGWGEYRRIAEAAWAALPPLTANQRGDLSPYKYEHLRQFLDRFTELDGDDEKRIALCTKNLSSSTNYSNLVHLCLGIGRLDLAIHWAEEGIRAFPKQPDLYLAGLAARLLLQRGRNEDAENYMLTALEAAEVGSGWGRGQVQTLCGNLCELARAPALDRAVALFETRIADTRKKTRTAWVDVLVEFLMARKMLEQAFTVARQHESSLPVKKWIARKLELAHPSRAIALHVDLVWQFLAKGTAFEVDALGLVYRLAVLHDKAEHLALLGDIKQRYAHRKSFMVQLGFHEGHCRAGTFRPLFPIVLGQ